MHAGIYKHYKGGFYVLLGAAEHTETGEEMAVYVSLTGAHLPGPRMRVRPVSEFIGEVNTADSQTANPVKRFEHVGLEIPQPRTIPRCPGCGEEEVQATRADVVLGVQGWKLADHIPLYEAAKGGNRLCVCSGILVDSKGSPIIRRVP